MKPVYSGEAVRKSAHDHVIVTTRDPMTNSQSETVSGGGALLAGTLARYDRIAANILQPHEFANRRRSAIMSGSPFETVRDDPFKTRAGRGGKAKPKRMPKGITPPISDPFHVSAPTHAQLFFNPLQSKSTRAALSQSAQVRALTAAAAASAQARVERGRVELRKPEARAPVLAAVRTPEPVEAPWTDLGVAGPEASLPEIRTEPVVTAFEDRETDEAAGASGAVVAAADGHGPAPQHPAAPQSSTSSSAYYGQGRNGGGGTGGGGGGSDGGGEGTVDPVQDDIVAGVLVAAFALLFGWLGYNAVVGPKSPEADGDALVSPQSVDTRTTQIEDLSAPNPFPPGPVDIRPSSPIEPPADGALQTQLRTTANPEPVELAQVETQTQPATDNVASPPPACTPGRAMRAYFCTASANLTPTARSALLAELDDWGTCAGSNELVVRGYADTRGAVAMNAALAASRAGTVAALLRERGLSVTEVEGVGELRDIEDERNCANQRRVDVGIKGDPPPVSLACAPPREAQNVVCG